MSEADEETADGEGTQATGIAADEGAAAPGTGDPDGAGNPPDHGGGAGGDPDTAGAEAARPSLNRIEVNILAALGAASIAYGTHDGDDTPLPRYDIRWIGGTIGESMHQRAEEAAAFLRQWPDAPMAAVPIHLRRKGFDVPEPGPRALVAWEIFAIALRKLDAIDRAAAAAAAEAAAREAETKRLAGARRRRFHEI